MVFGIAFGIGVIVELILLNRRLQSKYRAKVRVELEELESMVDALELAIADRDPTDEDRDVIVGVRAYVADARKRWKL